MVTAPFEPLLNIGTRLHLGQGQIQDLEKGCVKDVTRPAGETRMRGGKVGRRGREKEPIHHGCCCLQQSPAPVQILPTAQGWSEAGETLWYPQCQQVIVESRSLLPVLVLHNPSVCPVSLGTTAAGSCCAGCQVKQETVAVVDRLCCLSSPFGSPLLAQELQLL